MLKTALESTVVALLTLKIAFRIADRKWYINSKDSIERKLQKGTVFNT